MSRITIDPVTRIEGHLRIDAEVDGGFVRKAWSSGQMFRGIERILQGRDPREAWLFTQRFCGVCTTVHAIASVRAVENALQLAVPLNAQYIRNIIVAAHAMHDHIVHFYHLSALDLVDVVSALKAERRIGARRGSHWSGSVPSPTSYDTELLARAIHHEMCYRGGTTPVCRGDLGDALQVARFIEKQGWRLTRIEPEKVLT